MSTTTLAAPIRVNTTGVHARPGLGRLVAGDRLGGQHLVPVRRLVVVGPEQLLAGHQRRDTICRRASLTRVDTSSPSGRPRVASATSSGV